MSQEKKENNRKCEGCKLFATMGVHSFSCPIREKKIIISTASDNSSPIVEEKAYNTYDHTHCWAYTKEYPPCGQKLKHYECCLCKKVHPEISQTLAEERERLVKEIEKLDSFTVEIGHGELRPKCMTTS